MAATNTAQRARMRRQLRGFILVWIAVTFIMGACTFFAIFWVLGETGLIAGGTSGRNFALPTNNPGAAAVIVSSPIPTREQPTAQPTTPPTPIPDAQAGGDTQAQAAAPTDLPPPTVAPTALPVSNKAFDVGIQVQYSLDMNPDNQDNWMREVAQKMRLRWFKQQVRWEDVQPERDTWDWSKLDLVMPSAGRFGLNVMLSIVTAPDWAREQGVNTDKHGPPANFADYVNFVTELLKRYPGQVQAIEVWNEQNLDREWTSTGGLSAANYVRLLRETFTAVKAIDPGVIVISGALAPTGGWTESDGRVSAIDDFDYLKQMIAAGLLNYSDCIGAHHNGYNIPPNVEWNAVPNDPNASFRGPFENPHHSWSFASTLRTYANLVATAGGDQKLCVTEFGWASTEDLGGFPPGFEFANDNTLEEQGEWIIQAIELMDEWDIVWLAFIWNFNYGPQAGWATDNDNVPYSIIGKDWAFRPAYDAIIAWGSARAEQGG
ncbi:MAG: beta-galactosidase [Anaerolineae bacterium]|nr:beta-galactosidase [Anaerolineae bacterium]